MAHNALLRGGVGSGLWIGIVHEGEWETFDQRQFESINGDLGGVWAPAAQIELGGAGLLLSATLDTGASCVTTLDGDVQFPNGFTCTGTATVTFTANSVVIGSGGELTAHCASHFNGNTTFGASAIVTMTAGSGSFVCNKATAFGDQVTASGPVTCNDTLDVAGDTTVGGDLDVTGDATAASITVDDLTVSAGAGIVRFNNAQTNIGGELNINAVVTLNGSSRIRYRYVAGTNGDHTYVIADGDMIAIAMAPLSTTTRTYTMSNTGCLGGEVIEIFNGNFAAQRFDIMQADGATLIASLSGSFDYIGVRIVNDGSGNAGSAWKPIGVSNAP